MNKLATIGIAIVIVVMLVLSMNIKVQKLERSPLCDQYRVSINTPLYISDDCIRK